MFLIETLFSFENLVFLTNLCLECVVLALCRYNRLVNAYLFLLVPLLNLFRSFPCHAGVQFKTLRNVDFTDQSDDFDLINLK